MDGMEKLFLLGGLGLVAYWLTNKATAAVATAHPSALPSNESIVVFNDAIGPDQASAILRGSFVNGLGSYSSPITQTAGPMLPMIKSSNPAMPVSVLPNAPVNDRWSDGNPVKTRPVIPEQNISPSQRAAMKAAGYIDAADAPKHAVSNTPIPSMASRSAALVQSWQDKEFAYLKANPNSTGPWIHNRDGSVTRGFPTPPPESKGLAPIGPSQASSANPNAPVYYNGVYQGTAAQVADSQVALARGQTWSGHRHR